MNTPNFQEYWARNFPKTPPINHLFKHHFEEKWLRVHSLPEAKRYAETESEWAVLLRRQHRLFCDLMPQKQDIFVVFGLFSTEKEVFEKSIFEEHEFIKSLAFEVLESIDLFTISKDWYDENVFFSPFFAKTIYSASAFTPILKSIANDEWRVFFVNTASNTIIAPYDGGVDLIFQNVEMKDKYKKKYKNWLSERADGL